MKMAVDIDKLVIEEGDCVGLVGESGCGKSTLAGIITNTVKLYSGSVIFKGEDISRFNARSAYADGERSAEEYADDLSVTCGFI